MGLRFRKSVGGKFFRLNFSANGISASAGVRGARVSAPLFGTQRFRNRKPTMSVGIPGTGLSYRTTIGGMPAPATATIDYDSEDAIRQRARENGFDRLSLAEVDMFRNWKQTPVQSKARFMVKQQRKQGAIGNTADAFHAGMIMALNALLRDEERQTLDERVTYITNYCHLNVKSMKKTPLADLTLQIRDWLTDLDRSAKMDADGTAAAAEEAKATAAGEAIAVETKARDGWTARIAVLVIAAIICFFAFVAAGGH